MRTAILNRFQSDDEGTFGTFHLDDGWSCFCGELPWRDNAPGKSCIPAGSYHATLFNSPKHGLCYMLQSVPDRSDVEIHSANWMGDADKGFKCQLLGCIALGDHVAKLEGQEAVTNSRETVQEFMDHLGGEDFVLTINEAA